jgi:uncharacterized SAM-binding protein YcdF (DUF218 family)
VNLEILKPLLSALVLPPAGPLLLVALGFLLIAISRKTNVGKALACIGLLLAWLLSCQAVAVQLDAWLLKPYPVVTQKSLTESKAQAIVVLGGGMQPQTEEYLNSAQISATTAVRLRYGAWLSKQTQLPLAFSGGRGWAAGQQGSESKTLIVSFSSPTRGIWSAQSNCLKRKALPCCPRLCMPLPAILMPC